MLNLMLNGVFYKVLRNISAVKRYLRVIRYKISCHTSVVSFIWQTGNVVLIHRSRTRHGQASLDPNRQ